MEDLKGKALRGGLAKLCGQAVTFVLRLAFLVVMARLLDPQDFGLVAMVTVVTGIYELFATAGLSLATVQKFTITDEQEGGDFLEGRPPQSPPVYVNQGACFCIVTHLLDCILLSCCDRTVVAPAGCAC